MAQRRMFSLKIVGSDAFLEMPTSARELYFQLGMYADDDGFVNPRKIMRMIGSSEDDIKVLIGKRFVLPFDNGVVVIKHWLINNLVRKDFYQETMYLEQKKTLEIKDNKAYTTNVNNLLPQVRLGKDSLEHRAVAIAPADIQVIQETREELERPPKKETYPNARKAFKWFPEQDSSWGINTTELKAGVLLFEKGEETVRKNIKYCLPKIEVEDFPIHRLTPYLLITNWNRIYEYSQRG